MRKILSVLRIAVETVLLVALAAGLALATYKFGVGSVLQPPEQLAGRRDHLAGELTRITEENEYAKQIAGDPAAYEQRVTALQQQMAALRKIVPQDVMANAVQQAMTKDAAASGVKLRDFTLRGEVQHGRPPRGMIGPIEQDYVEMPFQVHVEGTYDSLNDFFKRVNREERLITTLSVSFDQGQGGGHVGATCVLSTYFVPSTPQANAP